MNSKARAVIFFVVNFSKYSLLRVLICKADIKTLCGFINSISSRDGGATLRIVGHENL